MNQILFKKQVKLKTNDELGTLLNTSAILENYYSGVNLEKAAEIERFIQCEIKKELSRRNRAIENINTLNT